MASSFLRSVKKCSSNYLDGFFCFVFFPSTRLTASLFTDQPKKCIYPKNHSLDSSDFFHEVKWQLIFKSDWPKIWKKNIGLSAGDQNIPLRAGKKSIFWKKARNDSLIFFVFGIILKRIEDLKFSQVAYFEKSLFSGSKSLKVNFDPFLARFCCYFTLCYLTISYQILVYLLAFVF